MPTSTSPGSMAPRNISPALVEETPNSEGMASSPVDSRYISLRCVAAWSTALESWSARMISTIEGGMIWPSVPEAAMVPVASGFE